MPTTRVISDLLDPSSAHPRPELDTLTALMASLSGRGDAGPDPLLTHLTEVGVPRPVMDPGAEELGAPRVRTVARLLDPLVVLAPEELRDALLPTYVWLRLGIRTERGRPGELIDSRTGEAYTGATPGRHELRTREWTNPEPLMYRLGILDRVTGSGFLFGQDDLPVTPWELLTCDPPDPHSAEAPSRLRTTERVLCEWRAASPEDALVIPLALCTGICLMGDDDLQAPDLGPSARSGRPHAAGIYTPSQLDDAMSHHADPRSDAWAFLLRGHR